MLRKGIPGALVALTAGSALATVLGVVSASGSHNTMAPSQREATQRVAYDQFYHAAPPAMNHLQKPSTEPLVITGGMPEWMDKLTGGVQYPAHRPFEATSAGESVVRYHPGVAAQLLDFGASALSGSGSGSGLAFAYYNAGALAGPIEAQAFDTVRRFSGADVSVPSAGQRLAGFAAATSALTNPSDDTDSSTSTSASIPTPSAALLAFLALFTGVRRRKA